MNRKIGFILVFIFLLFLAACEQKISAPTAYIPDNADHAMMFQRELYTDDNNYTIGYNNGNIRSTSVKLDWNTPTSGVDTSYLATKLYRDGALIKTINSRDIHAFTDSLLTQDRYYTYTVAQLVSTGMSIYDTLTVKTPSVPAPTLELSVPSSTVVKLSWKDMSDINGTFVISRNNIAITPVISFMDGVYSCADTEVYHYSNNTYRVYKQSDYDQTAVVQKSVYVQSTHVSPLLQSITQEYDGIHLQWTDRSTAEDQIKIYRKLYDDPDTAYSVVGSTLMPNQTEFLDQTVHYTRQRYTYAVSAVNRYLSPPVETLKSNEMSVNYLPIETHMFDFEDNDMSQFYSYGTSVWTLVDGGSSKGMCAKSGNLNNINPSYSYLDYSPGLPYGVTVTVEFDYFVVSSHQYNRLYFYCGNSEPFSDWINTQGWQSLSYTFVNYQSDSNLHWHFYKENATAGDNYAMLDNIRISYVDNSGKKVYVAMGGLY